ncbi:MAG: molybdenum cofactor guanylyltransferase [Rubrobacter sp.]
MAGIILAGGRSRRMGFDKLRAEIGGVAMLELVYGVLRGFCQEVVIVGEGGAEIPGAARIRDSRPGHEGPLAGLEAGLAATTRKLVFVCAGDLPFANEELALLLLSRLGGDVRAAVPVHPPGSPHPLFAAYERGVEREVREALDARSRSMRAMLSRISGRGQVEYVGEGLESFGEPETCLVNVNSPEDLDAARAIHDARNDST